LALESGQGYADPARDVEVWAEFSCRGEAYVVDAFWDGGRNWRARFSPEEPGEWVARSFCSRPADSGLHGHRTVFTRHSDEVLHPVKVAPDGTHFQRRNQPFFWLGDTAWSGPLKACDEDWLVYLADRANKGFNAIQIMATHWMAACGDAEARPAYLGQKHIELQPEFFRRMDRRIASINDAGMLAVPVLAWAARWNRAAEAMNPGAALAEDELAFLIRYMVARWDALDVAWILAGDGIYEGAEAERWKRVGRRALARNRRPVTMHPAAISWLGNEFAGEPWLDFLSYQSGHLCDQASLRWLCSGPPRGSVKRQLPSINLEPCYEGHRDLQSGERIHAYEVRRAGWWSVLCGFPCGVSYGAHGVWSWEHNRATPLAHEKAGSAPAWDQAIKLPGSRQMGSLRRIFESLPWWRLRPTPEILSDQPGLDDAGLFVAAASTPERDCLVFYAPRGARAGLCAGIWRSGMRAECFDPALGEAVASSDSEPEWPNWGTTSEGDRVIVVRGR
jgi:hypothetical protein